MWDSRGRRAGLGDLSAAERLRLNRRDLRAAAVGPLLGLTFRPSRVLAVPEGVERVLGEEAAGEQ